MIIGGKKEKESYQNYVQVVNELMNSDKEYVLETKGSTILEIYFKSNVDTDLSMDVSADGNFWINDYYVWRNVSELKEGFFNAWNFVRIRVSKRGEKDTFTLVIIAS